MNNGKKSAAQVGKKIMYRTSFESIRALSLWMVERIGQNKDVVIDPVRGADWNWVAAETWRAYPGIFNEFTINDSIDLLIQAAERSH